jgi:hypothetical protein
MHSPLNKSIIYAMIELVSEYILPTMKAIQQDYGVNPIWFIAIYIGSTPLFLISLYYTVKFYRNSKPLWLPLSGLFVGQFACYAYLFSVGRDLPLWVYFFVIMTVAWGLFRTVKQIRRKIRIDRDRAFTARQSEDI